jgi:hypothetical protein
MAKKLKISPLEFKYSSATVRFFGKIVSIETHLVAAKINRLKMICPNNLVGDERPCKICAAEYGVYGYHNQLALVWDCRAEKWAAFPSDNMIFKQIYEKSKAAGANAALIEAGQGPDVHIQTIMGVIETEVDAGTIGAERGGLMPSMDEFLAAVQHQSIWLKYDSASAVMNDYPYPVDNNHIFTPNWNAVGSGQPISGCQFINIIEPLPEKPNENNI